MLSYEIWEIFKNTYFEEHLGDIQKVRSLKIPEFWPPIPPCSPFFIFDPRPPPKKKYVRFG